MKILVAMLFVFAANFVCAADADNFVACTVEDTYGEGETTCYVDSVNGNDANDGLSEASPVKSQSGIDSECTVVRFKRGSVFNEKLAVPKPFSPGARYYRVKVYTNYGTKSDPLPHFKVPSEPGRGPVILSFFPLIIDGLHFSGARGDNTMEHDFDFDGDGITKGIVGGIGAFLGAATTFINNEVDDCNIGIMLGGEGSVVRGNYVHDLIMGIDDDPGVDPNLVGGAEGIFINASNCEVSYNTFVNCTGHADWVGSNGVCDGGATEVSAASGGTIENVHVHHNFSYNSCGFFEVATYFGDRGKGLFRNSSLHNNVIVDSAWMGLLQVNNTDLDNIHFYNNTLIQHPGSLNAGILWIIFTSTSSGMEGGELVPGTVHLTNNLFVLDGISRPWNWLPLIDPAFVRKNNIAVNYSGPEDPNYVDLGFADIAGTTPSDFILVNADSPAVDAGLDIAGNKLDYFNRVRPHGRAPDIGAMEFGSAQAECIPRFPGAIRGSSVNLALSPGGAAVASTAGSRDTTRTGYAALALNSGAAPYGTAVFSFKQGGVTVTETGVPASPPTARARIFVEYRKGVNAVPARSDAGTVDVNTGIAVVNYGSESAEVTYTLRDMAGAVAATGHGTIAAGKHFACFIDELRDKAAPDFRLPPDFQSATQFGSLEIAGSRPLSVLGLRGTYNQRHDFLITTTPIADLTQALAASPIFFPQFVDGGGYTTALVLLNGSGVTETGSLQIMDHQGAPFVANPVGGAAGSSFRYKIDPHGAFRFQTDGFPAEVKVGWVRLIPDAGTSTPMGSGVFGFNPQSVLVSESGIPAADYTTHARVYVDLSENRNTGIAIANLADVNASITIMAFQNDGVTEVGTGLLRLDANGHAVAFATEFIAGLPAGFTGVLDVSSETPFSALTLRSLHNERDDFLMTTFPVADSNRAAPSPIVFPQIADGGGYITQFILINPAGAATTTLDFYAEDGTPW